MPNVIDYQTGERIDPVTGKPIKRVTTGAVPTDFADMLLPVAVGNDLNFAPGFGSNLTQTIDYYDQAPTPPRLPTTQAPSIGGQLPNPNQGNSNDARNDDKTNAGAVNDFGNWVDAIMHGAGPLGLGGPFGAVAGQIAGTSDYGDTFGNANQEDPEGWQDAVQQATNSSPPGTPSSAIAAKAAQIYANAHPGWGEGAGEVSGDTDGLGGIGPGAGGGYGTTDSEADQAQSEGIGDISNEGVVDPNQFSSGSITTASGTKPTTSGGGMNNQGGGGNGGNSGGTGGKAGAGPTSGSGGSGGLGGPGPATGSGGFGGPGGSGGNGNKKDGGGFGGSGEAAGGQGYNQGGYVDRMPASMTARMRPQKPTEQPVNKGPAAQPTKPGPGAIKDPTRQSKNSAFTGLRNDTKARFTMSTEKGFNQGGFVPKAGYNMGGSVGPEAAAGDMQARFNPTPEQIASDGITDNQPINADEGEFVINRESAEILGPEILNGLNNPETALILSDLVEDVLALQAGGTMGGGQPAPTATPAPAGPPMAASGANPSQGAMPQQQGPGVEPSGYRRGGYVTAMRGSLSKVRC